MQEQVIARAVVSAVALLLLSDTFAIPLAKCQSLWTLRMAQLAGTVTDTSESRIPKAKLEFQGQDHTWIATAADDGTYKIDLPPGLYKVRVSNPGFCPMNRALFIVRPSSKVTMNFIMFDCALEYGLTAENGRFTVAEDRYRLPFKEESLFVGSISSPPLNLLVQFGEKQEDGASIEYKGFKLTGDRMVGVTVTYDLLTIHADNVRLNRTTLQFEAEGNVVVENGSSRFYAAQVSVELKARQPTVKKIQ